MAYSSDDQVLAQAYIDENKKIASSIHSVFTTHSRAIHSRFKHNTIIFDEDPLPLLLDVDTLKIADLKKIRKSAFCKLFNSDKTRLITLQRYLEDVDEGDIQRLPDEFRVDIAHEWHQIMQTEGMDSNIMKFLDCQYFYKDESDRDRIHFITRQELPTDKKIIIMSATVPAEIFLQLYGQRVEVIDITDVEHKGTITQHTKYSYSRSSLKEHLDEAIEKLPNRPTITFKGFNSQIETATPDI